MELRCITFFILRSHMSTLGTFYYCDVGPECTALNIIGIGQLSIHHAIIYNIIVRYKYNNI